MSDMVDMRDLPGLKRATDARTAKLFRWLPFPRGRVLHRWWVGRGRQTEDGSFASACCRYMDPEEFAESRRRPGARLLPSCKACLRYEAKRGAE